MIILSTWVIEIRRDKSTASKSITHKWTVSLLTEVLHLWPYSSDKKHLHCHFVFHRQFPSFNFQQTGCISQIQKYILAKRYQAKKIYVFYCGRICSAHRSTNMCKLEKTVVKVQGVSPLPWPKAPTCATAVLWAHVKILWTWGELNSANQHTLECTHANPSEVQNLQRKIKEWVCDHWKGNLSLWHSNPS